MNRYQQAQIPFAAALIRAAEKGIFAAVRDDLKGPHFGFCRIHLKFKGDRCLFPLFLWRKKGYNREQTYVGYLCTRLQKHLPLRIHGV